MAPRRAPPPGMFAETLAAVDSGTLEVDAMLVFVPAEVGVSPRACSPPGVASSVGSPRQMAPRRSVVEGVGTDSAAVSRLADAMGALSALRDGIL